MSHGPPPSDSEDDYDGFSVNLMCDDTPQPPEEKDEFFEKFKRSLTHGDVNLLRECFNDDEYEISVNIELTEIGRTPLLMACRSGSLECVQYLVDRGAQIEKSCNHTTCLMAACEGFDDEAIARLVKYLVPRGADVDYLGYGERTVLMMACRQGLVRVVRFLANHSDLEIKDRWNWTALFHAVDCNQLEIVRILVEKGAEIDIEDTKGYKLYQVAEMKGFHDIIGLFPQQKKEYVVPSEYLSYSNVLDLVPREPGECPPYYPDIKPILYGSGCERLSILERFTINQVTLFQLLTMTDAKLCALGVEMPFERKKILHGLYRFHSQPWSKSSLNQIDLKGDFDVYDVLTISTTNLKHTMIQLASCYHVMNHNPELKFDAPSLEAVTHTRAQIKALKLRIRQLMASVQKVPSENHFLSIVYLRGKSHCKTIQRVILYSAAAAAVFITLKYLLRH